MSIASEITRLQGVKSDILTAIGNKGVTVPSGSALDDCPGLIGDIPTGGGLPEGWEELHSIVVSTPNNMNISLGGDSPRIPNFIIEGNDIIEIYGILQRTNGIPYFTLINAVSGYTGYNIYFANEGGNLRLVGGTAYSDLAIDKSCAFKVTRNSDGTVTFTNGSYSKTLNGTFSVGVSAQSILSDNGNANTSGCGLSEIRIKDSGGTLKHDIVPAKNGSGYYLYDKVTDRYTQITNIGNWTIT